jgi:transposase InsO family protein
VVDVARRYGVARQTLHAWLRRYAAAGLGGLADQSSRPASCPHQIAPQVEARIVALRRAHPGWGPRSILTQLGREGTVPLPGRSSVYRALVRHGLIQPQQRRRRRQDYKRWERSRAMELWQLDIVGRIRLADGTQLSAVTGIDDHSRFCVLARLLERATARPVCDALRAALARHGAPQAILTDNGKVFTARFGPGPGPVLFDRVCHDNGIRHLLTAPYSPTTTGKVERLHKTMRREFFDRHLFDTIEQAQAALDAWVVHYNTARPHQGIGDRPPADRFALAPQTPLEVAEPAETSAPEPALALGRPAGLLAITRRVADSGRISLAGVRYLAGRVIKVHPIRHDRAKEHGAFATPNGRPRRQSPTVA